jgi:hypothetical protein
MTTLTDEIARRRTFAITSHPDAGKTTLTEKLLLFGGAIQLAGEVKARAKRRRVRSDWMAIERERGISVSSALSVRGSPSTRSTRQTTRIQCAGRMRSTAFIPVSYLMTAKFIGWQASLLNGRGALAAPGGGLHPPYALVLGYMAALAAGAPDAAIAG